MRTRVAHRSLAATLVVGVLGTSACSSRSAPRREPPPPSTAQPKTRSREVVFRGMCDASGAVALSPKLLVAADDEDNVLRIYDAEQGGAALSSVDVSAALGVPLQGKRSPSYPEVDLEAATRLGDRAYWLSSHGRTKKGKLKAERLKFFATTVPADDNAAAMSVVGTYERLLDDLVEAGELQRFGLDHAAERAPQDGGLNIEGLTATPDGQLLIGLRNPVPSGGALIIPLVNPSSLFDLARPERSELGSPIQVDLGGLGIRSLSWWRGRYLILAGASAGKGLSRLFTWDGRGQPVLVDLDLSDYNPEGFFSPEERDEILLLSDDGSVPIGDVACKDLDDAGARRFRGLWVRIPGAAAAPVER